MLENTKDKELTKTNLMLMAQWRIGRHADTLQSRSHDDPEFVADLEYLVNSLAEKLEDIRYGTDARALVGTFSTNVLKFCILYMF